MTRLLLLFLLCLIPATAADLKPETVAAYRQYVAGELRQMQRRASGEKPFLAVSEFPALEKAAKAGEPAVFEREAAEEHRTPGGLIQHWVGAIFVPGVTAAQAVAFIQDYDNHSRIYRPEVLQSKLISRDGDRFHVFFRLLKKKVITVVLNTEHEVRFHQISPTRFYSVSETTKVREVDDPGQPSEAELPLGEGQGFLWRMDAIWRFDEHDRGVWIECESITLSRSIPMGLAWMISPIVKSLPREAMANTMTRTLEALRSRAKSHAMAIPDDKLTMPGQSAAPPRAWVPAGT